MGGLTRCGRCSEGEPGTRSLVFEKPGWAYRGNRGARPQGDLGEIGRAVGAMRKGIAGGAPGLG